MAEKFAIRVYRTEREEKAALIEIEADDEEAAYEQASKLTPAQVNEKITGNGWETVETETFDEFELA